MPREKLATKIADHIFNEHTKNGVSGLYSDIKRAVLEALPEQDDINKLYNPLPALFKELADELAPLDDPNYTSILREAINTLKLHKRSSRLCKNMSGGTNE